MTYAEIISTIRDNQTELEAELVKTGSQLRAMYARIDAHDDDDFFHPAKTDEEFNAREAHWSRLVDAADALESKSAALKRLIELAEYARERTETSLMTQD